MTDEKMRRTDEEFAVQFLRDGVASRLRRLHSVLDQIAREAEDAISRAEAGHGFYASAVAHMEHGLAWGLANAEQSSLITTAAEADIAHAKGE
jgi:hypothetical protein